MAINVVNTWVAFSLDYQVVHPDNPKHPEWGLSFEAYDKAYVPTFCNGPCYGAPISTYRKMYKTLTQVDFREVEKLDDLILTGMIRAQHQWKIYEASGLFCWHLDNKKNGVLAKMEGWYNLGKSQMDGASVW